MTDKAIDISFDFRTDTPERKDPDTWSPTLCRYHRLLWGKALPSGKMFQLEQEREKPPFYIHHCSGLGEFWLSSDSVMASLGWHRNVREWITPEQLTEFRALGYTIGGMMIYPAVQINRKWTINQARGCLRKIRDRFDLTMECVRRHYLGEDSPMAKHLNRYGNFFALFGSFQGYVDHFLLQDIVMEDYSAVRFFTDTFNDFQTSAIPQSQEEYLMYRDRSMAFIRKRNARITAFAQGLNE